MQEFFYIGQNWKQAQYILVAVTSSGILKAKQKLGITFNSDKLGGINFTKFSKLTMCSQCLGGSPGHRLIWYHQKMTFFQILFDYQIYFTDKKAALSL